MAHNAEGLAGCKNNAAVALLLVSLVDYNALELIGGSCRELYAVGCGTRNNAVTELDLSCICLGCSGIYLVGCKIIDAARDTGRILIAVASTMKIK